MRNRIFADKVYSAYAKAIRTKQSIILFKSSYIIL